MSSPTTSEPRHDSPPDAGNSSQSDERTQPVVADETAEETDAESETVGASEGHEELSLDLVFEILKNSRRREVLRYLKEERERVTLSELAEHVAAIENDTTVQALSSQQRKRVYVGLYQCHLPKLDDMDVVDFNQSRGHVDLGPNAPQLDKYLYMDEAGDDDRQWHQYYLGFAAVSAVVLLGGAVSGVLGSVGAFVLSVAIVLGLAGIAGVHAYERAN